MSLSYVLSQVFGVKELKYTNLNDVRKIHYGRNPIWPPKWAVDLCFGLIAVLETGDWIVIRHLLGFLD